METLLESLRTMDVNLTRILFALLAAAVTIGGLLINVWENHLPVSITRTYCYGKFAVITEHALVSKFETPKRWFKHFYEFAAPASSIVLVLAILRYIYHTAVPNYFTFILDLQLGSHRQALVTPETTLLAMILLTVQCWKRLYETHCISIFSDGKMNCIIYLIGFVHYLGVITCVVGESQGFVEGSNYMLHWGRLTNLQYICAIIFLLASYEQLKANYILANLRKDKKGNVVTTSHKIPKGRLFEYISAPLQFMEIIMYMTLSIILWRSSTYHYVFLWVLANQTSTGILTHQWYLKTFPNYPKNRNALIPYLL